MKRALVLVFALCGCKPTVPEGHFACVKDADCASGWFCGGTVDKHCFSKSQGERIACDRTAPACATGWFCGQDDRCHDAMLGEKLPCSLESDCGGGWRCGVQGVCYDRTKAGEIACRRDAGSPDGSYAGGDCADLYRCGVDALCHPSVDAGTIACNQTRDFLDCTDGWRCGAEGRCLDPSGEALESRDGGIGAVTLIRNRLPATDQIAASTVTPDGKMMALVFRDDAGFRHLLRRPRPMGDNDLIINNRIFETRLTTTGNVSGPFVANLADVIYFRNGTLTRGTPAGEAVILTAGGSPVSPVTHLAPLGDGWTAAWTPDGGGFWRIPPASGGASQFVPFNERIEAIYEEPNAPCALLALFGGSPVDGGTRPDVSLALACLDAGTSGVEGIIGFSPSSVRVSQRLDGGRLQGTVFSPPPTPEHPYTSENLYVLAGTPESGDCSTCGNELARDGVAEEFWPFEDPVSGLGAEIHCRRPTDAGVDRWWVVINLGKKVGNRYECREKAGELGFTRFVGLRPANLASTTRSGIFTRYEANPRTGNGQAWMGSKLNNSFGKSDPWYFDRPPFALGDLPEMRDGGGRLVMAATTSSVGQLTQGGFIADENVNGVVGMVAEEGVLMTNGGQLRNLFDQRVRAQIGLSPFPADAELHVLAAARAGGTKEWVASVDDQLFSVTFPTDGRQVTLLPTVRPAPGVPLLSIASRPYVAGQQTLELYANTRSAVFRIYLDELNRWRFTEVKLTSASDFVKVWITNNRARVGDASGAIYSLPSGLLLARPPGAGTAVDFAQACNRDLVLMNGATPSAPGGGYVLEPPKNGVATWKPLGLAPDSFAAGRIHAATDRVFFFGATGDAQQALCTP